MIQRDLSMWSLCLHLGMKFQNHVMIRDNTDVNGIFFTGVEYLLSLNLRHFIKVRENGDFEEKSGKIEIITPLQLIPLQAGHERNILG